MSNLNRNVYEGWTPQCFINDLEPLFNQINSGNSWHKVFTSKTEIREWCKYNQPYYKKHIPEVANYFIKKAKL